MTLLIRPRPQPPSPAATVAAPRAIHHLPASVLRRDRPRLEFLRRSQGIYEPYAGAAGPPLYRMSRMGEAAHFGRTAGEVRFPGLGYEATPSEVTLFAKVLARSAADGQRPLASCSDDAGLGLAIGAGSLRLWKGGVGWVDGRVPFPRGVWAACAISYLAHAGQIRFFLYNYATGGLGATVVTEGSPVRDGDGVATLNGRSGASGFVGAMTAAGLAAYAWSVADFLKYVDRPVRDVRPLPLAAPAGRGPTRLAAAPARADSRGRVAISRDAEGSAR